MLYSQLAIAFHSDPVARHHPNFYHTDCHKKASHAAFVLLLSQFHSLVCCCQVPGNIRRAEHFVAFLRRFVAYLKEKLGVNQVETENPTTFLAQLQERLNIDGMRYHAPTSCDPFKCCKPVSQLQHVFCTIFCCCKEAIWLCL